MARLAALAALVLATADALIVRRATDANATTNNVTSKADQVTFQAFYNHHATGRGIWKWNNALDAYQRHFGVLAGRPINVAEVGVQSGGSMLMWKGVLGSQIKLYGLDINPECRKFTEENVTITIGDQGDYKMWEGFFAKVNTELDILVDDGGHEPHQMLTTLQSAFPYIRSGGYLVIEDIAGTWYLDPLFKPAASFLAQMGQIGLIDSIHIYPLVLVVRKGGFESDSMKASEGALVYSNQRTQVSDFTSMWTAVSTVPAGSHIHLQNPAWTNLFTIDSLNNFFSSFIGLHEATFKDTPTGCSTTAAPVCTNEISPVSHLQSRVSGVHIYKDHAVIEVPPGPPRIAAIRKGDVWINYR